jgi:MFS family permease
MLSVLRNHFAFDQAAAGFLTTAIFLTHAAMQIPGGRLADSIGPARVIGAALLWIATGNIALALAGGYWSLFFWKAFTGLGTGTCFVAGARYTVSVYSGRALQLAQGLYGASIVLGSGFVIFGVPQLLETFGWRGAFLVCGGIALVVWLVWLLLAGTSTKVAQPVIPFRAMLVSTQLWLLGLVQMTSFGLAVVLGAWITTLLVATFRLPLKIAGVMGSLVLLLGIAGRPLGGWLLRQVRVTSLVPPALFVNALGCLVLALSVSLPLTWAAIVALGFGCALPYAGIFNRAAALFPDRAGAAMGLVNMVGIGMILAGAPLVGFLADWSGHFRLSFLALGAFAFLAALASLWLREE